VPCLKLSDFMEEFKNRSWRNKKENEITEEILRDILKGIYIGMLKQMKLEDIRKRIFCIEDGFGENRKQSRGFLVLYMKNNREEEIEFNDIWFAKVSAEDLLALLRGEEVGFLYHLVEAKKAYNHATYINNWHQIVKFYELYKEKKAVYWGYGDFSMEIFKFGDISKGKGVYWREYFINPWDYWKDFFFAGIKQGEQSSIVFSGAGYRNFGDISDKPLSRFYPKFFVLIVCGIDKDNLSTILLRYLYIDKMIRIIRSLQLSTLLHLWEKAGLINIQNRAVNWDKHDEYKWLYYFNVKSIQLRESIIETVGEILGSSGPDFLDGYGRGLGGPSPDGRGPNYPNDRGPTLGR